MTYGCKDSSDAGLLCLFTSEGVGKRSPFPYHRCVLRQTLPIIFRMVRSLLYRFSLLLLLLLVACQPQPDTLLPETTLTVVVAAESTLSEDAYPLSITVRTNNDYRTRAQASLLSPQEKASFSLPTWMQYQLILQSAKGAFASVECILRDQPKTVCLFLSGSGVGETEENDTIFINFDDLPPVDSAEVPTSLPAFVDGHLVVFADTLADSLRLTYLSLVEWEGLPSANHVSDSLQARDIADAYQEMALLKWHIPSVEEAKRLRALYPGDSESFAMLCSLLESASLPPIALTEGSENARYLCDEGRKTFSFVPSSTIAKAGTKAATYRLRLLTSRSFPLSPQ